MKNSMRIKRKLPDAPEPTRAVYKKPVMGEGKFITVLPSVYNPRPAPIPKRKPKPKPKIPQKLDRETEKLKDAVKASKKTKSRWWTEERIKTLMKLHREELTYTTIAKQMGTSKGAIASEVMRLVDRGLLESRVERDRWSDEDLEKLMDMRAEGKSFGEISDAVGRSAKLCAQKWRKQNEKQRDLRSLFS